MTQILSSQNQAQSSQLEVSQKPRVLRIDLSPLYELAGNVHTSATSMLNKILYEYDLYLAPAVVIEKQSAVGTIYVVDLKNVEARLLSDNPSEEEIMSVLKEVCSEIIIVLSTGYGVAYACW